MDKSFPEKWIKMRGPVAWFPRSHDLMPYDLSLWGHVKDKVYVRNPQTMDELKLEITTVVNEIHVAICQNVYSSLHIRLQRCIEADGHQIQ